jgi:hypothetical protein
MSDIHQRPRSRWSPARRAASAVPSRWRWRQQGFRVVGTATTEAGAAGITEALAPPGRRASCST